MKAQTMIKLAAAGGLGAYAHPEVHDMDGSGSKSGFYDKMKNKYNGYSNTTKNVIKGVGALGAIGAVGGAGKMIYDRMNSNKKPKR